jgi:hypothetical protein
MKSLTSINVDGDYQQAWEVYTDDTREQTFGFIFDEADAERVERMLLQGGKHECNE